MLINLLVSLLELPGKGKESIRFTKNEPLVFDRFYVLKFLKQKKNSYYLNLNTYRVKTKNHGMRKSRSASVKLVDLKKKRKTSESKISISYT